MLWLYKPVDVFDSLGLIYKYIYLRVTAQILTKKKHFEEVSPLNILFAPPPLVRQKTMRGKKEKEKYVKQS